MFKKKIHFLDVILISKSGIICRNLFNFCGNNIISLSSKSLTKSVNILGSTLDLNGFFTYVKIVSAALKYVVHNDILIKTAVCKVTMTKNIVATAIAGRNGTVKELISAKDHEIEVTFTLINSEDEYPAEALRLLSDLARENSAVYVDSAFLRLFDIDRVVVEKLELTQSTYGNTQEVVLTLQSDNDYEVEVTQTI